MRVAEQQPRLVHQPPRVGGQPGQSVLADSDNVDLLHVIQFRSYSFASSCLSLVFLISSAVSGRMRMSRTAPVVHHEDMPNGRHRSHSMRIEIL